MPETERDRLGRRSRNEEQQGRSNEVKDRRKEAGIGKCSLTGAGIPYEDKVAATVNGEGGASKTPRIAALGRPPPSPRLRGEMG